MPDPTPHPAPAAPPRRSRAMALLRLVGGFAAVAAVLLAAEGYLRWLHAPSEGLAASWFHTELNVSRWAYLDAERDRLRVEDLLVLDPHEDMVEQPEPGRPPFDRVERPFHVRTNAQGYREREIAPRRADGARRVLVLGDSVSWGKGVDVQQRWTERLRAPGHVELYNLAFCGFTSGCIDGVLAPLRDGGVDLVVLQASSNDVDQALWRLARADRGAGLARLSERLAHGSRLALTLRWVLRGDPYPAQLEAAHEAAAEAYGDALDALFADGRERGYEVAVFALPQATGRRFGDHVVAACERAGDDCLGALEIDLDQPRRWLVGGGEALLPRSDEQDFVDRTAAQMGIDDARLDPVFPHRALFHDIVHLNAAGHAVVALQLEGWLAQRWSGWVEPPAHAGEADDETGDDQSR